MGATIRNILTFSPQNVSAYAWLPLAAIWFVVALVMIADVLQTARKRYVSFLWILAIILLPGVSAVIYALSEIMTSVRKTIPNGLKQ
jgi:hypothetical protein